jgi:hypothetical protein
MAAGALVALVLTGLYFAAPRAAGDRRGLVLRSVLAPAPTFSRHSLSTFDCVQCHREGHQVEDVRCERCHDPDISARLSNAAHVFSATADMRRAIDAPVIRCVTCHVDHRDSAANLSDVDDRECGSCHRITENSSTPLIAFSRHPEFDLVRAGPESGTGLRWFNHQKHLAKVSEKFDGRQCDACHERQSKAASYNPITFARHCAVCHEEDLSSTSGSFTAAMISALGTIPAPLQVETDIDDPTEQRIRGVVHADAFVLRAVQTLRSGTAPAVVAAERLTLAHQLAGLELMERPISVLPSAWTGLTDLVQRELSDLDRTSTVPSEETARLYADAVRQFAVTIAPVSPDAGKRLDEEAAMLTSGFSPKPDVAATGGIDSTAFDVERQQILNVLDGIQRALRPLSRTSSANPSVLAVVGRVAALRQRVLEAQPGLSDQLVRDRAKFFLSRQLDRARVDSELDALNIRISPPTQPPSIDRTRLKQRLDRLRQRLRAMEPIPTLAGTTLSADDTRRAIASLLGKNAADAEENAGQKNRCTLCHELAPDGLQLAPMRAAGSMFLNATFTHDPHVSREGQECERCHASISRSTISRDLNIPGVEHCRACHAPGREAAAATSCESCHTYHVPPETALVSLP